METILESENVKLDVPQQVLDEAVRCCASIAATTRELIAQKFRLGGLVCDALHQRKCGDGVVRQLAEALSRSVGKTITPERLYEAARVYTAFGGNLEKVWDLDRTLSFPLTYSFLIRHCVPAITAKTAWNREELARVEEVKLEQWERTVLEIEAQAQASAEDAQLAGFQVACRESRPYERFAVRTIISTLERLVEQVVQRAPLFDARDWDNVERISEKLSMVVLARTGSSTDQATLEGEGTDGTSA